MFWENHLCKFLDCILTSGGIIPLSEKVSAITNFPKPSSLKELRRFLTLINFYRSFLPNAAGSQDNRDKIVINAYAKGAKKNNKTPISWREEAKTAVVKIIKK
ncbi:hypothetical protein AVEN_29919-1 [Araneus ventricosus]|uniref:Retrovirus-related Pol polyprotein from transposon opus n=1 Tax=Araneus ventricosus TaxID=182803 RepID=A0A4Y2UHU8_ARAVE|nr:hypothetical protein AVEN_29919-1 [Araneus ventricosus]